MKPSHGLARASAAAKPNDPMPGLQGQPAIDYLKQHGLFESVKAAVEAHCHEIHWKDIFDESLKAAPCRGISSHFASCPNFQKLTLFGSGLSGLGD